MAALVRQLGLDRVVLVGHSTGGAVALEAASLLDTRVDRIGGLDTLTYSGLSPRQSAEAIDAEMASTPAGPGNLAMRALLEWDLDR